MLLKIQRLVLKKVSTNMSGSIELSKIGNYSGEEIYQTFLDLKDLGYFREVSTSQNREAFSYILTTKGKHYREHSFLTFLRNFIIPFLVALITTAATYNIERMIDSFSSTVSMESSCNNDELSQNSK